MELSPGESRSEELPALATERTPTLEIAWNVVLCFEHVEPTGVEDDEVVPVFLGDECPVLRVGTSMVSNVALGTEPIGFPQKEAGIVERSREVFERVPTRTDHSSGRTR
jgi:hypothetical protein